MKVRVDTTVAMVMLLRDFGPYGIIFMNVRVDITVAMVMLLRDFGPYVIIFMNVRVDITVAMVMLLRDFGPYGILFTTMCVYFTFSRKLCKEIKSHNCIAKNWCECHFRTHIKRINPLFLSCSNFVY
jgi:hypothetical protein